jgi:hypothetical protein
MNRSSPPYTTLNELVTLLWCALGQVQTVDGEIDDETYHFFTVAPPLVEADPLKERTQQVAQQPMPLPLENEAPSMDSTLDPQEAPPSVSQRRLEKLLPRPFSSSPADTASTRKHITASAAVPHLSSVSLYQDPPSKPGDKRWAVFSYLPPANPPSPKEIFITSVVTAIGERLPVQVTTYSCYDPSFSLHLPVIVDDCEVVLFFVDSHLKGALTSLLESAQTFSLQSQPIETPFTVLGTLHGRPLRALILHTSTHEDTSIKGALWQSLKSLATKAPPQ